MNAGQQINISYGKIIYMDSFIQDAFPDSSCERPPENFLPSESHHVFPLNIYFATTPRVAVVWSISFGVCGVMTFLDTRSDDVLAGANSLVLVAGSF